MCVLKNCLQKLLIPMVLLVAMAANAVDQVPTIDELQSRFDVTNFELTDKAQLESFEQLKADAELFTTANPDVAEGWVWSGIIKSSYAGAKGGLGALKLAKQSKVDFEKSMELDADAMQGAAYNSLGTLYYSVPGWPLGFGNDKKAEEYLLKALEINPDGIVSNYFYAEFLVDQKRKPEAIVYYKRAQDAPLRPNRPIADEGRRKDITAALADLEG
jgi:tetratricopeptide (TPR) repeat protein